MKRNDGAFRDVYGLDLAHERKICATQVTFCAHLSGINSKNSELFAEY